MKFGNRYSGALRAFGVEIADDARQLIFDSGGGLAVDEQILSDFGDFIRCY